MIGRCGDCDNTDVDPSKCDGVRPRCSGCEELGFECVYVSLASNSNVIVGKEYLSSLEDRLKAVEQVIRATKAMQNRTQLHPRFDDGPGDSSLEERDIFQLRARILQSEEVEVNSDELQDSFCHENPADGMGAMVFSAEEDCGFFGTAHLVRYEIAEC